MWQINLAVEEASGGGESLGKHVCNGLVGAGLVQAAVDPLAALCKGREVERFDGAVLSKVGKFHAVVEPFIPWNVLGWVIAFCGI